MATPTVLDDFTIDRTAAPAPYAQIEQRLAHMIESGRLAPGDRLPSERDVAARVGVSRSTARAALAALAQRGLVERGAGRRGTCVAAPRLAYDLRDFAGFTEMARRQGLPATARVLAARELAAPPPVAEALGLRTDARAYRIERLRYVGGKALALEDTWLPAAPFRDLLAQDLSGSLYALMGDGYDRAPVRAVERLEATVAGREQAQPLGIPVGAPLMLVVRTAYAADGGAVEFARDHHRGDRARFIAELELRPPSARG